jgi:hypothetical protein
MNPARSITTIATALAVLLSSCTSPENPKVAVKNTITQQQAVERVEQYIREVVTALAPRARLEVLYGSDGSACDDPTDNGPRGRVIASRSYWLRDIPAEKNEEYVTAIVHWWTEHDFGILTDDRPNDVYVWAENRRDGFRMSVQQTATGPPQLSLGATSPCVWPNGTPEPKAP